MLCVSQVLNLPMKLTIGQATTEVTVTGQEELLETEDANAAWYSIRSRPRSCR